MSNDGPGLRMMQMCVTEFLEHQGDNIFLIGQESMKECDVRAEEDGGKRTGPEKRGIRAARQKIRTFSAVGIWANRRVKTLAERLAKTKAP